MDYLALIKSLREEALLGIQYKRMKSPFKIFAFITMLPYIISALFAFAGFYVLVFVYNGVAAAADYLESWVDKKKQDIHPATEAVLYFITMPFIFLCHCLLSVFAIFFYFGWFSIQLITFIATLGGTRWQPFLYHSKFGEDVPEYYATTKHAASSAFAIVNLCFLGFTSLLLLIYVASRAYTVLIVYSVFLLLNELFVYIAVPSMFRKSTERPDESYETPTDGNSNYGGGYYSAPVYTAPQAAPSNNTVAPDPDDFLPEL